MILSKILDEWQNDSKFEQHVSKVSQYYEARRNVFHEAQWYLPKAGMFFWLKILNCPDTANLIEEYAVSEKVLLVPGKVRCHYTCLYN
jgi:DNA-binding transcriptional MocR family regulator